MLCVSKYLYLLNVTFCVFIGAAASKKFDLQGKRVIFTGTLANATRKEAESEAKNYGCFVGSAVSKNIDLVIAGEEPGEKVEKAKSLGE